MTDASAEASSDGCATPQARVGADWLRLLRTSHWVKNAIVFPYLVLLGRAGETALWAQAGWVLAAFCLASSGVYVCNDIFDREVDRLHPLKSKRPVAAGRFALGTVAATAVLLALAGLAVALAAAAPAALCVALYLGLNLAYSLRLKHLPLVDAGCVAAGFVLRGVAVVGMPGHSARAGFLAASLFALCLFVAFSKRAADLALLRVAGLGNGASRVADGYTPQRLRGLLAASAVLTLLCYLGFVGTVGGSARLAVYLSCLPVAGCLFRLARLSLGGLRTEQIDLVRKDVPLIAGALAWTGLWVWAVLG